jgi:hypothetical protein
MKICKGSLKYSKKECTSEGGELCEHYTPHNHVLDGNFNECMTKTCHMSDHVKVKYRRIGYCVSEFEIEMIKAIKGEGCTTKQK